MFGEDKSQAASAEPPPAQATSGQQVNDKKPALQSQLHTQARDQCVLQSGSWKQACGNKAPPKACSALLNHQAKRSRTGYVAVSGGRVRRYWALLLFCDETLQEKTDPVETERVGSGMIMNHFAACMVGGR